MPRKDIKAPPVVRAKKITLFDHWKAKLGLRKAVAAPVCIANGTRQSWTVWLHMSMVVSG
jgi:hypothetical protein